MTSIYGMCPHECICDIIQDNGLKYFLNHRFQFSTFKSIAYTQCGLFSFKKISFSFFSLKNSSLLLIVMNGHVFLELWFLYGITQRSGSNSRDISFDIQTHLSSLYVFALLSIPSCLFQFECIYLRVLEQRPLL